MFKSIKAKNFMSWENLYFEFSAGVTQIVGWNYDDQNSEGAGKSAIINALTWCLYGKTPKEGVNVADVVRRGEKACKVTVELQNGYTISRSRRPNTLVVQEAKDGAILKFQSIKEAQEYVNEKLIGIGFETFCQGVYFPQNWPKKFISSTEEERAKILSEIQDLSSFDRARKKAVKEYSEASSEAELYSVKKDSLVSQISSKQNSLRLLEESYSIQKTNLQNLIQEQLSEATQNLQEETNKLMQLEQNKPSLEKHQLEDTIQKVKNDIESKKSLLSEQAYEIKHRKQLETQIELLDNQIAPLEAEVNSLHTCPTCDQDLNPGNTFFKNKKAKTETKLGVLYKDREALVKKKNNTVVAVDPAVKETIESLTKKLTALENSLSGSAEYDTKVKNTEALIQSYDSKVVEIQEKLAKVRSPEYFKEMLESIEKEKSDLVTLESELEEVRGQLVLLKDKIYRLGVLKDGFKEIKSYVFTSFLQELNEKSNEYLGALFNQEATIKFSNITEDGNTSKITVDFTLNGEPISMGLLSGGQHRRAQIAVDLAISDIISSRASAPIDLIVLDEAFKDLSETSVEKILNFLETRSGTTIIIEHNSMIKSIIQKSFKVELKGAVSRAA